MIKLKRPMKDGYNYVVDFFIKKEAIIGVYDLNESGFIVLASGVTIEIKESAKEVLKLLE